MQFDEALIFKIMKRRSHRLDVSAKFGLGDARSCGGENSGFENSD
jgi:hypothetical protein